MKKSSRRHFFKFLLKVPLVIAAPKVLHACNFETGTSNNLSMNKEYVPSYIRLHKEGILSKRSAELWARMEQCDLCPRDCKANRLKGERGTCGANADLRIASFSPHFGEERELVGRNGSGTIFLSYCSLLCVFCINYDISHGGSGQIHTVNDFADMMLRLQRRGCHNINLVTPTHYMPHILKALDIAAKNGLNVPLVYNTCGWEKLDVLSHLDKVVDIYLTDFKYYQSANAARYSAGASSYPEITKKAHLEMQRQVGTAKPAANGLMYKGLMIRHLVMPNNLDDTENILAWIGKELPKNTYVNIMSQYRPMYKAFQYEEIARGITAAEYKRAEEAAIKAGLTNYRLQR